MFAFMKKIVKPCCRRRARCPGRAQQMDVPAKHFVNGHPLKPPFPAGLQQAHVRHGLLLGRRAHVLGSAGRVLDRGRLRRRRDEEPDLRGSVQRHDQPHRGGARGVRPEEDQLRGSCSRCSGRATTRRRACARATTRARNTARPSIRTAKSSAPLRLASKEVFQEALKKKGYGAITTEIREAPRVLLRRGLSPAIPRQESRTAIAGWRHRRLLPRGSRGQQLKFFQTVRPRRAAARPLVSSPP